MKVRDIGIKEIFSAEPSTDLSEIASMMKRYDVGTIPVCEGDKLLGMVTDRDIVTSCVADNMNPKKCLAKEFMTTDLTTVTPDIDLGEAAALMGQRQVRRLPVVEGGNLVGIISLGDIAVATSSNGSIATEALRQISSPTPMRFAKGLPYHSA